MIDLQECNDICYAEKVGVVCDILVEPEIECNYRCPFYKPKGCKDWVRSVYHGRQVIYPPEEYERRFKGEDKEPSAVYWRISTVLKSKV